MGAKHTNEKGVLSTGLDALRVPLGTRLTEPVSLGRTGREWHLPMEAERCRINHDEPSGIKVKDFINSRALTIKKTCEFLREHAPNDYRELYKYLKKHRPVDPKTPSSEEIMISGRWTRYLIFPGIQRQADTLEDTDDVTKKNKEAPVRVRVPKLGKHHWAHKVHNNPGEYTSPKSGDPVELCKAEVGSDLNSIAKYIGKYRPLAEKVSGRNLWDATLEPEFKAPYFSCMKICVRELQMPSHFLSLIHYGIGVHFMNELSLPWKRQPFRNAFTAIARLYREDFCS